MPRIITHDEIINKLPYGFVMLDTYTKSNLKHRFVCPFCNRTFLTTPNKVISKHTKSCGCAAVGRRKGRKYISSTFFARLIQHAKSRQLVIDIDIDFLEQLLIKQNFKCALSGVEISVGYTHLNNVTASVDRIDNNIGYTKNNVQFVHKDINWMKQDFLQQKFIDYCKLVTRTNEEHKFNSSL